MERRSDLIIGQITRWPDSSFVISAVVIRRSVRHFRDIVGFIIDRCAGEVRETLFHQPADLEFHRSLLGHLNRLQSFGFCARRALRNFVSNTPKSRNSNRLPFPNSFTTSSKNC